MEKETTNKHRLTWLTIVDLAIVLVSLHVLGAMFGSVRGPAAWPLASVRAFQNIIPSIYDIDVDPIYGSIRGVAIFWLWLSLFRCIASIVLILMKRKPLFANIISRLVITDAIAALFVVPLYVR
ncbi:hypothetical protein J7J84_07465 [bacterium]|nr:hypothetical protein [bacterium]